MKLACVVAVAAGLSAPALGQLYGVAEFTNFGTMGLYSINAANGDATLVGNTGLRQIVDIAYDRRIGVMYALTSRSDLYSLDLATGAAQPTAATIDWFPLSRWLGPLWLGVALASVLPAERAPPERAGTGPTEPKGPIVGALQFLGRNSLELYTLHYALLCAWAGAARTAF
jgi:hypothetical protein